MALNPSSFHQIWLYIHNWLSVKSSSILYYYSTSASMSPASLPLIPLSPVFCIRHPSHMHYYILFLASSSLTISFSMDFGSDSRPNPLSLLAQNSEKKEGWKLLTNKNKRAIDTCLLPREQLQSPEIKKKKYPDFRWWSTYQQSMVTAWLVLPRLSLRISIMTLITLGFFFIFFSQSV